MMKNLTNNIKNHPLAWYYTLSVLIVIVLIPIFLITGSDTAIEAALQRTDMEFNTDLVTALRLLLVAPEASLGIFLSLLQVAAPDIAVLIVTSIAYGKTGLLALKNRLKFWHQDIHWRQGLKIWIFCIVVFTIMNLATAILHRLLLPQQYFIWNVNFLSINFLGYFMTAMFLDAGGLFEENGWRGFALPILQKKFQPLLGSIILGTLWSFWHMPVKANLLLTYGMRNFVSIFFILTIKFILLSIIMTYFFNLVGQTTIIAIAMHGLSNDSVRLGGEVLSESFTIQQMTEFNLVMPMFIVAMIIIWLTKGKLGINFIKVGVGN